MREFLLGLRLLFGAGRGSRVRFLLMAAGGSLGVCCLALVLTIPQILDAHDGRVAARQPQSASARPAGATLVLQRTDPYGSQAFTRVFVARGIRQGDAVPPGLERLPGPGEVFLSPRAHDLLRDRPAVKGLLPGREEGLIGAAGLAHPDELFAYVGTERGEIADEGRALKGWGYSYAPFPAVEPSTLTYLRFALGSLVLLPLGIFLSVCARLSAASRNRRLASLRLLGLSIRGTQRVNAAETVVAALLGALLGLGEYVVLNQVMTRTGLPSLRWYPDDGALSASTVAVCLIGCPLLAWFVGRMSAREAAARPLAVRRSAAPARPARWGGLLLVTGLGIVAGYCATGFTDHPADSIGLNAVVMPAGILLTGLGLVLTLPLLSYALARRVARRTGSLTLSLAMRRNEVEPGSTMRVVTGLVLLVVTRPSAPVRDYALALSALTDEQRRELAELPGVRGHAVTAESWLDPESDTAQPWASAVVATCGQLARMVKESTGCVDGKVMRLSDPDAGTGQGARPGDPLRFRVREGGKDTTLTLRVPRGTIAYDTHDPSGVQGADLLVPPSALPDGARLDGARYVLTSGSDHAEVRRVLDGIAGVVPTAEVEPIGVNVEGLRQIAVLETLLAVGMVMGLVIGTAAFVVSATDRAMERRAQVTAVTLIGARARTLRAVQCVQVVVPLSIGLVLALVAGKLAESAYLITGGGETRWDLAGVPVLALAAAGVVAVSVAGTLPLVGRRVDPELIRRD
ncbi:ABC transporter permease [Streptomyces nigra]|uniref:ABC transporter permease n=1 Tax=Streptomyces nigra TaxID=1827580 RepID=UPI0036BB7A95